ncbi:20057_t:CDS:1 [Cetraspora pellucida]|uniref:20057_t:CDS:1 n=1 Tax=Cetraspora pellucida TaxID=1433469 RepID=A0A9N9K800_9GLOM|nr:20057_t:CDS:1 [Cetraspora pellucida]
MINDNYHKLWLYNDTYYEKIRLNAKINLTDILTNEYNPKPIYWQEELLHQFSHRVYQELLLMNKKKEDLNKLSNEQIEEIVNETIKYWTLFFNTRHENTQLVKTGLYEFINMINNHFTTIWNYHDGYIEKIKKSSKYAVESIVTEIYSRKY